MICNNCSSLCFVNPINRRALIFSPRSSQFTLQGVFSVEHLLGSSATLHGYDIQLSTRYIVYNISSQSLISIENGSSSSKSVLNDHQILSFFSQYQIDVQNAEKSLELIRKQWKRHHGLSIFFIEQYQTSWMESIQQSSLVDQSNSNSDQQEENNSNANTLQSLWKGLGAFQDCHVCLNHFVVLIDPSIDSSLVSFHFVFR